MRQNVTSIMYRYRFISHPCHSNPNIFIIFTCSYNYHISFLSITHFRNNITL